MRTYKDPILAAFLGLHKLDALLPPPPPPPSTKVTLAAWNTLVANFNFWTRGENIDMPHERYNQQVYREAQSGFGIEFEPPHVVANGGW